MASHVGEIVRIATMSHEGLMSSHVDIAPVPGNAEKYVCRLKLSFIPGSIRGVGPRLGGRPDTRHYEHDLILEITAGGLEEVIGPAANYAATHKLPILLRLGEPKGYEEWFERIIIWHPKDWEPTIG